MTEGEFHTGKRVGFRSARRRSNKKPGDLSNCSTFCTADDPQKPLSITVQK
jgi:hypothetical protein